MKKPLFPNDVKKSLPLWKWVLLILFGSTLFLFLSQTVYVVGCFSDNLWIKALLLFLGGSFVLGLYVLFVRVFEKRIITELRLGAIPDLLKGFAIGTLFIASVVGIFELIGVYRIASINVSWSTLLLDFSSLSIVAISEEIIFRGIIFRMIESRFNMVAAFIISSLIFGFMHLVTVDLWTAVAISAEAGFLLAAAYKLHHNLWLPIGIHWAWNFVSGTVFGFEISGNLPESGLIIPDINGPYILSGGNNGFEGSIITCICGITLGLALYYYGKRLSGKEVQ